MTRAVYAASIAGIAAVPGLKGAQHHQALKHGGELGGKGGKVDGEAQAAAWIT